MKHFTLSAIAIFAATSAFATVSDTPSDTPSDPPSREKSEPRDSIGGNKDVEHGCLTTWSTKDQRMIQCKQIQVSPRIDFKGGQLTDPEVTISDQ